MVKLSTIHIVLSLALSFQWPIRQLDIQNAFLNGDLQEQVYMHQPPGFVNTQNPSHVCCLHKVLYGLKQAPERGSLSSTPIYSHLVFKILGLIPHSFSITQLQIYSLYSFMLMTFLSPGEAQLRSSPSSNTSTTHLLFVISGTLTIFWELKSLLS